jgi:hypothetical protein
MGEVPGRRPDLRVSDADRDAVIAELGEHFQAGRLNAEEFGERLDTASSARTRGDLDQVMVDLPRTPRPVPPPAQQRGRQWVAVAGVMGAIAVVAVAVLVAGGVFGAVNGHTHWHWHAGSWWAVIIPILVLARLARGRRGPD